MLRTLPTESKYIDFCSNDYLGLARIENNRSFFENSKEEYLWRPSARLLSGNYDLIEKAEKTLAIFHHTPAALIFNSGYNANIGLMSSVAHRGDVIVYDQFIHASLRDGIRLSHAQAYSYLHNNAHDLEKKIKKITKRIFVVTESLFGVDSDQTPIVDICNICEKYGAYLIVDEGHTTGVIGSKGEGVIQHFGLEDKVFARVHTFSKALAATGAVVVGSNLLKQYLINYAHSFIYTSSMPPYFIRKILYRYEQFPNMIKERERLIHLIQVFKQCTFKYKTIYSDYPIQTIVIPQNHQIRQVAYYLQGKDIEIRPLLSPTVPKGAERFRINLHAFNTIEEIKLLEREMNNFTIV